MLMPLFISTTIVTDNLLKGEIISEGDIATAFCSSCFTEVTIRYEYLHFRSFRSESGDLMMGACTECSKLISVPAQAAPLLLESTTERKLYTIELRLPRPLIDILRLVASYFNVPHDRFRPALLRYYVEELLLDHSLIVRNFPEQYWRWHEYGSYLSPLLVIFAVIIAPRMRRLFLNRSR